MVHTRLPIPCREDGSVDIEQWMTQLDLSNESHTLIKQACELAQVTGEDRHITADSNCFLQGLELAEILAELNLDADTIAAGIVYSAFRHTDLTQDDIKQTLGKEVAKLVEGLQQADNLHALLQPHAKSNPQQIDNARKMILAMASDMRIVAARLAAHLCLLRQVKNSSDKTRRQQAAKEAIDIFAPLANRLGLYYIKWELEDLAFSITNPDEYKAIAKQLDERRVDREKRVDHIVDTLKQIAKTAHVTADIYGRAKHIYSIKRKMDKKHLPFDEIYDAIAVRVLVDQVEDCYKMLSFVHDTWEPIHREFDDYIATPKPNGYQSIHTAVFDEDRKKFEVQIRTHAMHEAAELGVAAHWKYKEGATKSADENKIACLRQILEWHRELTDDDSFSAELEQNLFQDRVYIFTPQHDIIDLPTGSTPLDFAYHVHSQIGHHCQGAKVSGKMVPLNYTLKTGDQVEILTATKASPSRDWLSLQRAYLKTSSARAKVLQWFKQHDHETQSIEGKLLLERELRKNNVSHININDLAANAGFKTLEAFYIALGAGHLRFAQIAPLILDKVEKTTESKPIEIIMPVTLPKAHKRDGINIQGIDHLLFKLAKCCKPIPGDDIIGYLTRTQGITIHRTACKNIQATETSEVERLTEASWNQVERSQNYPADIEIIAHYQPELTHHIATLLLNEKVPIMQLCSMNQKHSTLFKIMLTIGVPHRDNLDRIIKKLSQFSAVSSVRRI